MANQDAPAITRRFGVYVCPTCGSWAQFAGFCAEYHEGAARLIFRPALTIEQVERARDEHVAQSPEASGTLDAFLKRLFDTPLLPEQ